MIGQVLYSRLHLFKNIAMERVNDPTFDRNSTTSTMDLELMQASSGPQEGQGRGQFTASQYYELMLETCERLFDNQVEQLAFEDQMREMFGLHARPSFFFVLLRPCTPSSNKKRTNCRTRSKYSPSIKFSLPSLNM
jgi:paired amphipathic helix protein Sin3a